MVHLQTAIVEGLAQRVVESDVPMGLMGVKVCAAITSSYMALVFTWGLSAHGLARDGIFLGD